jgi:hypothetical protein
MAVTFEWGEDLHGRSVLLARKARGKISVSEIQEVMMRDERYHGAWAVLFRAREDSGYQGWGDDEPKGDVLELYQVGDGEKCPLCAAIYAGVDYCPHCGEMLRGDT